MDNEETRRKRELVKLFRKQGGYARRIEDAYSVGFPDMVLIPPNGLVFFCEAKIIRGRKFAPSPRQYVELLRLSLSPQHSVPCVLGFDGDLTYLHPYAKICPVADCTVQRDGETLPDFFNRFYTERYATNV